MRHPSSVTSPPRRHRAHAAGAALALLVGTGIAGSTSTAQAVEASPIRERGAVAQTSGVPLDPVVTAHTTTTDSQHLWEAFEVTVQLTVPDSAREGDTFTVILPPPFRLQGTPVELRTPDGQIAATGASTGSGAGTAWTYTFTDYVDTHDDVALTFSFWARAASDVTLLGSSYEFAVEIDGVPAAGGTGTFTGRTLAEEGPGSAFTWMEWNDPQELEYLTAGVIVTPHPTDIESLTFTVSPRPGGRLRCETGFWIERWTELSARTEILHDALAATPARADLTCAPRSLVVTVTGTPDDPALPAGHYAELVGTMDADEKLETFTIAATVTGSGGEVHSISSSILRYASSGSAETLPPASDSEAGGEQGDEAGDGASGEANGETSGGANGEPGDNAGRGADGESPDAQTPGPEGDAATEPRRELGTEPSVEAGAVPPLGSDEASGTEPPPATPSPGEPMPTASSSDAPHSSWHATPDDEGRAILAATGVEATGLLSAAFVLTLLGVTLLDARRRGHRPARPR